MRALPWRLQERALARVLIMGGDGVCYRATPKGQSWKQILIDELHAALSGADWVPVQFPGRA